MLSAAPGGAHLGLTPLGATLICQSSDSVHMSSSVTLRTKTGLSSVLTFWVRGRTDHTWSRGLLGFARGGGETPEVSCASLPLRGAHGRPPVAAAGRTRVTALQAEGRAGRWGEVGRLCIPRARWVTTVRGLGAWSGAAWVPGPQGHGHVFSGLLTPWAGRRLRPPPGLRQTPQVSEGKPAGVCSC